MGSGYADRHLLFQSMKKLSSSGDGIMRISYGWKCFFILWIWLLVSAPLWAWKLSPSISKTLTINASENTITAKIKSNHQERQVSKPLTMLVTATRLKTAWKDIADSLSMITAQDIQRKQAQSVLQALQGTPGLFLTQDGAPGEIASVHVQGASSGQVLVLMDGIPLNDPIATNDSFSNWDQLFAGNIDHINIVRGPLSAEYGTNAGSGVINIITQSGSGPLSGFVNLEGGAYQTFHESAEASAGNHFAQVNLFISQFNTQGFPSADRAFGNQINDGDRNTTSSIHAEIAPTSNLTNTILIDDIQSRTHLDAQAGIGGDDPNYFLNEQQWIAGDQVKWKLLHQTWEQILNISNTSDLQNYTDQFSSYPNSHYEQGVFDGRAVQASWQNNFDLCSGETVMIGLRDQRAWGSINDWANYGYGLNQTLFNQSIDTQSEFAADETTLFHQIHVSLNVRNDHWTSFGDHVTHQEGLAYWIPGWESKLRITYGTGFRIPSLYQLYSPYGNVHLQPEQDQSWEAGMDQFFQQGKIRGNFNFFHTDFSNLIDFNTTATPPYGQYVNIGLAQTQGFEIGISDQEIQHLNIAVNYTYTLALNVQTGLALLECPKNQWNADIFYQWNQIHCGINIFYVGTREDDNYSVYPVTLVTMPSYVVVNLTASYQISPTLQLYGRIDNLFNEQYEEIYGYGTARFSTYIGTKINF
jgi:vitamin B12 transporter